MNIKQKHELGNGFVASFQENTRTGDVRAVVKDAAGAITQIGEVVTREKAHISLQKVIFAHIASQNEPVDLGDIDDED